MLTNVLKGWRRQRTATSEAWTTDSQSLIEICERYWASPCELVSADTGGDGLQAQYDRARRELLARFEECAAWAVELSALPESQPRSLGLDLLARAAHAGALGEYEDAAVRAFLETLDRPMRAPLGSDRTGGGDRRAGRSRRRMRHPRADPDSVLRGPRAPGRHALGGGGSAGAADGTVLPPRSQARRGRAPLGASIRRIVQIIVAWKIIQKES